MERRRFALRASGALKRKLTKGGELPPFVFNYPLLGEKALSWIIYCRCGATPEHAGYLSSNDFSVIGDFCLVGCRQHRGQPCQTRQSVRFWFFDDTAGFSINFHLIDYKETSPFIDVFVIGILNTLLVSFLAIFLRQF